MPSKFVTTEYDVAGLRDRLRADPRTRHLRVRKHGATMVLESGPADDPIPHVRLRKDGVHLWILEARGRNRWEPTGFRADIATLLDTLVEALPWVIAPLPATNLWAAVLGFLQRIERRGERGTKGSQTSEFNLRGLIEKATPHAVAAIKQRETIRLMKLERLRRKRVEAVEP